MSVFLGSITFLLLIYYLWTMARPADTRPPTVRGPGHTDSRNYPVPSMAGWQVNMPSANACESWSAANRIECALPAIPLTKCERSGVDATV